MEIRGYIQRCRWAAAAGSATRLCFSSVPQRRAQWAAPPTVVCFLPLSGDVDIDARNNALLLILYAVVGFFAITATINGVGCYLDKHRRELQRGVGS